MKKGIYLLAILIYALFISEKAALIMMALFGLFELIDINENAKTK